MTDKLTKPESRIERLVQTLATTHGTSLSTLASEANAVAQGAPFLLVDCSSSMLDMIGDGRTKFEAMRAVYREIASRVPNVRTILFPGPNMYSGAIEGPLPEHPYGSTPLHKAFDLALALGAKHVVVISDGQPDDHARALEAADRFGGRIDVFYIGTPGDMGDAFLARLARQSGGQHVSDAASMLTETRQKELVGKVTLALKS